MRYLSIAVILLATLTSAQAADLYNSGGFEGYAVGDLPGQDGWVEDTTDPAAYGMVQVVSDPLGPNTGKMIMLDPPGTAGGWLGAFRPVGPATLPIVTIEWDQYRTGLTDNLWYADVMEFDGWWAMQWDANSQASSYFFEFGVPLTANTWQHVKYTLDYTNQTATVEIAGVGSKSSAMPNVPVRGIAFELEPTESGGADGPTYIDNLLITQTPEPATLALLSLVGLAATRRRR